MLIGIDASRAFIDGRTGTENYSYHLIKEILRLPDSKLHTFVLFTRPNAILPEYLDGYSNVIVNCVQWKYLWTQLGLAWETWRDPQIQVLWVPAHTLPILRNPRIKTVVTIHGLEYQWLPEYKNLLQRWYLPLSTIYAAKHADKIIAVSNFTKSELIKELQSRSNRPEADQPWAGNIKMIQEGVDIEQRTKEYRISKDQANKLYSIFNIQRSKYILFVGTIQPRKNLASLIEAFSKFVETNPGYKLVIAGGTGWMAEDVFRAPTKYNVQDKVVFTGRVSDSDLQILYRGACIYVQPSLTEGFGLPILEAMNAGVPVISSDGGALKEVVGNAGLIVQLNNQSPNIKNQNNRNFVSELAVAMDKLVGDDKLRAKLVAKGKKRVSELNWVNAAKETFKLLITTGSN